MTDTEKHSAIRDMEGHINALLDEMTLEEQVALLAGADFWTTVPVERVSVPAIKVTDGPNGARGGGTLIGGVKAASFPVGISLASTWNPALVEQVGQALAEEAQSKGARVLLAPTVNIHRSTLNGRNFECYSEDPYLSAQLAVAYIRGVQSKGVSATVKHYVGNESEFERMTISSEIDERSLREIYFPPFEAAVKQAGTWAVMSSYNKVNGTYVSESRELLIDILKHEWGFDGVVMSDWFATHSVKESARRMLQLIARVGAFDDPTIPEEQAIDRPEHRALIRQAGAEGCVLLKNDGTLPLDPHTLKTIAVIGPNAKTAQIMGGGSAQVNAHYRVSPYEGIVAQVGESVEVGYEWGCSNHKLLPLLTSEQVTTADGQAGFSVEYFNSPDLSGDVVLSKQAPDGELMWFNEVEPGVDPTFFSARITSRFTPSESGSHHLGLVSVGPSRLYLNGLPIVDNWNEWQPGDNFFGAGNAEAIGAVELQTGQAYDLVIEYGAPADKSPFGLRALRVGAMVPLGDDAIDRAAEQARESDVALLFVGLNGQWDTEGQDRPNIDLPGRQNELIERVAAANPKTVVVLQTGAPVTMPWLDQVANAIADVLFGVVNPSGKLPQTFPKRLADDPTFINYPGEHGRVRYGEGIFVGYRYYEKKQVEPLFPFGYGLSYTSFAYDNLKLSANQIGPDDELTVTIDVTNTGQRAGQETVQLYVRDVASAVARPEKELKGSAKVSLEPGETATVTLSLDRRALAYWDDAQHARVAEAGSFEVMVGGSSRDIHARAGFQLAETVMFDGAVDQAMAAGANNGEER